jgi:hypothetical protein
LGFRKNLSFFQDNLAGRLLLHFNIETVGAMNASLLQEDKKLQVSNWDLAEEPICLYQLATFIVEIIESPEKYIRENLGVNKPNS